MNQDLPGRSGGLHPRPTPLIKRLLGMAELGHEPLPTLIEQVGTLLLARGLEATPQNYAAAYAELEDAAPRPAPEIPGEEPEIAHDLDVDRARFAELAEELGELIGVAQGKLDGAAVLVGLSADHAGEYGQALTHHTSDVDATAVPSGMVGALVALTHTMIERAHGAEARLRTMGEELDTLQHDLTEARLVAEHDSLTGLPNRRALEKALQAAIAAAHAANRTMSLAFCDIDRFKRLNDLHGHAVGDRVLRLVADCLADGAGAEVMVGRQGGEEFVMLFPEAAPEAAAAQVDAIREELAARHLRSRTSGVPIGSVTFSAGVAGLAPGESGDDLLRRADRALYLAKNGGRNRVAIDRDAEDAAAHA